MNVIKTTRNGLHHFLDLVGELFGEGYRTDFSTISPSEVYICVRKKHGLHNVRISDSGCHFRHD